MHNISSGVVADFFPFYSAAVVAAAAVVASAAASVAAVAAVAVVAAAAVDVVATVAAVAAASVCEDQLVQSFSPGRQDNLVELGPETKLSCELRLVRRLLESRNKPIIFLSLNLSLSLFRA